MDIPSGLVINRADIGDNSIKSYAEMENLPVLMEIPFDRRIAEAYSRGNPMVEVMPKWEDRMLGLFCRIQEIIERKEGWAR